jgi:molecular chaperone GrpE
MNEKENEKTENVSGSHGKGKKEEQRAPEREEQKKKKKEEVIEAMQASLAEKEKQIEELKERQLYQQAEFENFKKLKAREKQEVLRFGNETLIKELLPVIDNLERAIEHAGKTDEAKSIAEGVALTLNGFLKALEKFDVTRIDALGQKFDPNVHEAIYQEETEAVDPGTVVSEFQKGYVMDGRLLRPSKVSVAKKPETV